MTATARTADRYWLHTSTASAARRFVRILCQKKTEVLKMSLWETEEDHLIHLISQNPALYDPSHKEYKNNMAKDITWKEIGQQLNKTSEECKKQWKLVRNSYARFKHKLGTRSDGALKKAKQKRYEQLKFLDSGPRSAAGSKADIRSWSGEDINISECFSGDPLLPNESEVNVDDHEPGGNVEDNESGANTDMEDKEVKYDSEMSTENIKEDTTVLTRVKKVNIRYNRDSAIKFRKQRNTKRQTIIAKKKDDDVDFFCMHIAEVLRNLPALDKAKAKKHLSDVISEYEISAATVASGSSDVNDSQANNFLPSAPNSPEPLCIKQETVGNYYD